MTDYRSSRVKSYLALVAAAALTLGVSPQAAQAHVFLITEVLAILKTDGTYQIDMIVDVDALALGVPHTTDSAEVVAQLQAMSDEELQGCIGRARDTILRRVRVRFNDEKATPRVEFPDHGRPTSETPSTVPTYLGTTARLNGAIPPGAESFTFGASHAFRTVHLTILDQAALGGTRYLLTPSEESPPYHLGGSSGGTGTHSPPRLQVAHRYLLFGFTHILPYGLDHILFVVGLFLLSPRLKPLLWQVTAFTIAHSITLALSMYDVVSLPSRIVEPLIALSIAYVAAENVLTGELKPWRPLVVFAFGLLHGMGFAGVLRELGLPRGEFVTALITFNVGVELGQITVVALAFLLVGWFQRRAWYRTAVVVPASVLIALVGLYWSVERIWGGA